MSPCVHHRLQFSVILYGHVNRYVNILYIGVCTYLYILLRPWPFLGVSQTLRLEATKGLFDMIAA